jgi:N6-adenosine-specific RNA methylase IME4
MLVEQPRLYAEAEVSTGWPFGHLQPGAYDFVMADPPWHFRLRSERNVSKAAQGQYRCMPETDIALLPVSDLCKKDAMLWLWATAPMLPMQVRVLERWGFSYCTMGAWHKRTINGRTAFGTGYRLRSACEPFLIGTRGRPVSTRGVRNLIEGTVREHSRKPENAYAAAEEMMPAARRVELFSRTSRPRWDTWGDEAGTWQAEEGEGA